MGQIANGKSKKDVKKEEGEEDEDQEQKQEEEEEEEEQDGLSVHSPCKISSSALRKENTEVELELKLLEALEIYPPAKRRGVHRHFVLYGLAEYMRRSFSRPFTAEDVLKLLDRFYNLDMVAIDFRLVHNMMLNHCVDPKSSATRMEIMEIIDDEDTEFLTRGEDCRLPQSYFAKEES